MTATAINLQNIEIAGVVLNEPIPNDSTEVSDVTVIALNNKILQWHPPEAVILVKKLKKNDCYDKPPSFR